MPNQTAWQWAVDEETELKKDCPIIESPKKIYLLNDKLWIRLKYEITASGKSILNEAYFTKINNVIIHVVAMGSQNNLEKLDRWTLYTYLNSFKQQSVDKSPDKELDNEFTVAAKVTTKEKILYQSGDFVVGLLLIDTKYPYPRAGETFDNKLSEAKTTALLYTKVFPLANGRITFGGEITDNVFKIIRLRLREKNFFLSNLERVNLFDVEVKIIK